MRALGTAKLLVALHHVMMANIRLTDFVLIHDDIHRWYNGVLDSGSRFPGAD